MFTRNFYNALFAANSADYSAKFITYDGTEKTVKPITSTSQASYGCVFALCNVDSNFTYSARMDKVLTSIPSSNQGVGVIFGNGSAPATMDDYKLSGEMFTTFSYSVAVNTEYDENGFTVKGVYTLTNIGEADFTVSEIGMLSGCMVKPKGNILTGLTERTVLAEPVTIPAGGIGMVTYTIRMNYPT